MSNADQSKHRGGDHGAFSAADFRAACSLFPSGVTVVTRQLADGCPYGMTVSSFTSVSLDPPLILVCVDRRAGFLKGLTAGAPFAVNVLGEHQHELAARFSSRQGDRFAGVDWTRGANGIPLLTDVVVSFVCALDRVVDGGDHLILIAAVKDICRREAQSLVWFQKGYHRLGTSGLGARTERAPG